MKLFNRYETIGIVGSIVIAALFLGVSQGYFFEKESSKIDSVGEKEVIFAEGLTGNNEEALATAIMEASNAEGEIKILVVQDISLGNGREARAGDTVRIHYVGIVRDGPEFDNTYSKGEPLSFVVGEGEVIPGLERGILDMREGGRRIVIIPSDLAYGRDSVGPIPPHATLIFSLELVGIE